MSKKKQSKRIQIILLIAGFIFACGGIYFLFNGINTYINQFKQKDWPVTTATVIDVEEYRSSRRHRSYRSRSTRYNILYQYETEGNIYTGKIYRNNAPKELGETFKIKYNPDAPEDSTQYLEPTFGIVISGTIGFIIFGFIGFRTIQNALPKKKKRKRRARSSDLQHTKSKDRSPKTSQNTIDVYCVCCYCYLYFFASE